MRAPCPVRREPCLMPRRILRLPWSPSSSAHFLRPFTATATVTAATDNFESDAWLPTLGLGTSLQCCQVPRTKFGQTEGEIWPDLARHPKIAKLTFLLHFF